MELLNYCLLTVLVNKYSIVLSILRDQDFCFERNKNKNYWFSESEKINELDNHHLTMLKLCP